MNIEPKVKPTLTITQIQDRQIAQELAAYAKHGKNHPTTRKVVFAARTRARKALLEMGFNGREAWQIATDAADMVHLELLAMGVIK